MLAIIRCTMLSIPICYTKLKNYDIQTLILPLVFYGCGTWSLTLKEERRLRVSEDWMLRRVFGP